MVIKSYHRTYVSERLINVKIKVTEYEDMKLCHSIYYDEITADESCDTILMNQLKAFVMHTLLVRVVAKVPSDS